MAESRDTRTRLLDAAAPLFARDGFDAVSIRDIAGAADVNVAAVNYHFQGKENLYREVLARVVGGKRDRYVDGLRAIRDRRPGDLEAMIAGFFRLHFEDTLKTEAGGDFLRLLVREMHHGTPERAQLVAELLVPMWEEVGRALLADLPDVDHGVAPWLVGSLHGQLIHFTMRWLKADSCRDLLGRPGAAAMSTVFPPLADDVDSYIERAVSHITRFTVAGIEAVLAENREPPADGDAT